MKFEFEDKFSTYTDGIETERDEHGRFFRAEIRPDDTTEPPWENSDIHGSVSGWYKSREKSPGERILCEDRSGYVRFYDMQESTKIAKRDGWGCAHEEHTTKGERAACAVEADFQYLRKWCNEEWWYVGVVISLHQEVNPHESIMLSDHLASVWGIESDTFDYLNETARELLVEALQTSEAHRVIVNQ